MSDRLKDQVKAMQDINLRQQHTIREYERLLERIGDEQIAAGLPADAFRDYWPGYLSPEERNARDAAHAATRPTSNIPRAAGNQ